MCPDELAEALINYLTSYLRVYVHSYEGGCPEALATYSAVAGVWSCCYSLGEVTGPVLGGALLQRYGFALGATICAGASFTMVKTGFCNL